jgi:hypothetical protein
MRFKSRTDAPDLHTQIESLLHQVWQSEADWRLWDRVDAAVTLETIREKRAAARDARGRATALGVFTTGE